MARQFEQHLEEHLQTAPDQEQAKRLLSAYRDTRRKLIRDIYPNICGTVPNLSEHGERHIDNVLQNVRHLITDSHAVHNRNPIELYLLAMIVLFHDVGLLFDREEHQTKISEIYNDARGNAPALRRERTLIIKAVRAHTGTALDGSTDTLKELDEREDLEGHTIRLCDLGAILRFADELAEGPQRTSEFMRTHNLYDADSQIYHDYASITNVHIDRVYQRIRLIYEIEVEPADNESDDSRDQRISNLLHFTYGRIVKLDQERRYARYYCELLQPFRTTLVALNFQLHGYPIHVELPPLRLDDKVIPGDSAPGIPDVEGAYQVDSLMAQLRDALHRVQES